jgi:hypothetical protein
VQCSEEDLQEDLRKYLRKDLQAELQEEQKETFNGSSSRQNERLYKRPTKDLQKPTRGAAKDQQEGQQTTRETVEKAQIHGVAQEVIAEPNGNARLQSLCNHTAARPKPRACSVGRIIHTIRTSGFFSFECINEVCNGELYPDLERPDWAGTAHSPNSPRTSGIAHRTAATDISVTIVIRMIGNAIIAGLQHIVEGACPNML